MAAVEQKSRSPRQHVLVFLRKGLILFCLLKFALGISSAFSESRVSICFLSSILSAPFRLFACTELALAITLPCGGGNTGVHKISARG